MYSYELKIPELRVAVLIGKRGYVKKQIEKRTNSKLKISSEGDVIISGEDNLKLFIAQNIIKAVGRGFNPEIALTLINEDTTLEIIGIQDFTGKSKKKFIRIKSRLIGSRGKARKIIERISNTHISILGKTVAIIGHIDDVNFARRAIEKLLHGAPHGNVYKFLEREKQQFKMRELKNE